MANNVVDDNNDVNGNTLRYAAAEMTERPYHHGNLRAELLEDAQRVVRENGVDALSLRELARRAGVSHAAPRRHFADRQALLAALAEAGFARLGSELRAAAEGVEGGFDARLRAVAQAYIHFAIDDAALLELMFAGKHGPGGEALHDVAEDAMAVMLGVIAEGQAEGAIEPGEPERVGLVLFATIQGIAALIASGMVAADQLDELVGDAVSQFLRGARVAS
jgi:AcrR family transcriptional regulator